MAHNTNFLAVTLDINTDDWPSGIHYEIQLRDLVDRAQRGFAELEEEEREALLAAYDRVTSGHSDPGDDDLLSSFECDDRWYSDVLALSGHLAMGCNWSFRYAR